MTPPAIQAGVARARGIKTELRARAAIVFFFFLFQIVVASFGLSVIHSQVPSSDGSLNPQGSEANANLAEQLNGGAVQPDSSTVQNPASEDQSTHWRPLLDEQLSQWEVFTGVPHKSVSIEGFPPSKSHDCRKGKPFGLGDPKNVYSVAVTDGVPVLHVSGEMYAGLTSREEFENFHLSTEFKWGEKRWHPRKKMKRDSGILFHCTGKQGAFWNVWMRCFQCQIQEDDVGDLIRLGGTSCEVRVTPETESNATPHHSPNGNWCTIGPGARKWGVKRFGNHEIAGDWNQIEVYAVGDRAVFSVNGHPVMHLKNTRIGKYKAAQPLTRGKIQVQSEAAEVWYRDMKIRPIRKLPAKLAAHFEEH